MSFTVSGQCCCLLTALVCCSSDYAYATPWTILASVAYLGCSLPAALLLPACGFELSACPCGAPYPLAFWFATPSWAPALLDRGSVTPQYYTVWGFWRWGSHPPSLGGGLSRYGVACMLLNALLPTLPYSQKHTYAAMPWHGAQCNINCAFSLEDLPQITNKPFKQGNVPSMQHYLSSQADPGSSCMQGT